MDPIFDECWFKCLDELKKLLVRYCLTFAKHVFSSIYWTFTQFQVLLPLHMRFVVRLFDLQSGWIFNAELADCPDEVRFLFEACLTRVIRYHTTDAHIPWFYIFIQKPGFNPRIR